MTARIKNSYLTMKELLLNNRKVLLSKIYITRKDNIETKYKLVKMRILNKRRKMKQMRIRKKIEFNLRISQLKKRIYP